MAHRNLVSYDVCSEIAAKAIKKTDQKYLNFFKGCPRYKPPD
jgi:hypothetical protein